MHRPFYHVVVTDSRSRRDSKHIEQIGFLNYFASGAEKRVRLDVERVEHWVSKGAVVRPSVSKLLRRIKREAISGASENGQEAEVSEQESQVATATVDSPEQTPAEPEPSDVAPEVSAVASDSPEQTPAETESPDTAPEVSAVASDSPEPSPADPEPSDAAPEVSAVASDSPEPSPAETESQATLLRK